MNVMTKVAIDKMLTAMGADSTQLGNASMGLIAAPFAPSSTLTLASITEANFSGYARKSIGNPTIAFTGADGNEYVEGTTNSWMPSDTVTPNTIYGVFINPGNSTTTLWASDQLGIPVPLAGPGNQLTATPRVGFNPTNGAGFNVISN
jgi:hypothetical protein